MPTITVPIEDLIFVLAALVGGGLLLVTVLLDDVFDGLLDALHIDFSFGGASLGEVIDRYQRDGGGGASAGS